MSADTSTRHKFIKKLKFAVGRPKNSKDVLKTLDRKKKGFQGNKKSQSRTDENVDVAPYDDKLYRGENGGKNKLKSSMKDKYIHPGREGYGVDIDGKSRFKPVSSDRKRKRIYADQDTREEGTLRNDVEAPNRKALPREGWNRLKDDFVKEKRTVKGRSRDSELSNRKNSSTGRRNSDANTTLDEKSSSKSLRSLGAHKRKEDSILDSRHSFAKLKDKAGSAKLLGVKLRTKGKLVDKMESVKMDGGGNGLLKKSTKSKSDLSKHLDQSQNGRPNVSLWKSSKKAVRDKKSLDGDSVDMGDQPMKSKRVIRIDPHDITNKRLDDGIVFSESTKAKKENLEKNVEISKNAQFRAIQPSPSILSFVEDNLLGRRRLIELHRAGYNIELSAPLDNVPLSTSSERERIEEPIFRNKLTFFAAAKISSSFPDPDLPEIAFAGRSNVGKSSLLNALTRQWGVVRTSDKPGLTQTINFFKLGSKLCMVDLPGYGFAYAKEEVKDAWEELVKEYVSTRVDLKRVCLLIDTKWGMKPRDHELIDLMERSQTKYQIVLTKTDTVFPIDVARRAMQIEESLKAKKSVVEPLMMVSSKSGAGIPSLRTVLAKIARFAKL